MASKNLKQQLADDAEELYNQKAAAMVPYPVDIYGKTIDVPENELERAKSSLMIEHLVNRGFEIIACKAEDVRKKAVFNPALVLPSNIKRKVPLATIEPGDRFRILSNQVIAVITKIEKNAAYLNLLGQMAPREPTPLDDIRKYLKDFTWEKLERVQ